MRKIQSDDSQHLGRSNRFLQSESGRIDWIASVMHARPLPVRSKLGKYQLTKIIKRPNVPNIDHLNIILLDTSASTLSGFGLQQSKAVIAAINETAYYNRDRLALICFGNNKVTMQIPPSKPRKSLSKFLGQLSAGGGTPFRDALLMLQKLLENRRRQQKPETSEVYILTDGRSQVDVSDLRIDAKTTLIDTECSAVRLRRCHSIAQQWQADYVHIDSIPHDA